VEQCFRFRRPCNGFHEGKIEVLGGNINSGGQRGLGTMTAPNPIAVQRCITSAMASAGIQADEVDTINGHCVKKTV
jgi:3-oxoacyl-(acyl-carrier-protein) synthase